MCKKMFERVGSYYYFLPTYKQGKKILWDGMDRNGMRFLDHFPAEVVTKKNETELKLQVSNGSIFQIVGTDNYDSIMGSNPVGCVFSEYSLQNPAAWDFIRPILAENEGWAVFNYTPRGMNHGHDLYQMAKRNPDWFCELLTVDDTQAIGLDVIEAERAAGMSEEMIQQEFWCSFEAAIPGAYFASQLRLARKEGRIGRVPHDPAIPVDTWWDLGMDDSTTIWFTQDVGREIHLIDYLEGSGLGLEQYVRLLATKKDERRFFFGRHVAPHDIRVRELGTGKSRLDTARGLGLNFDVAPKPSNKEDAIQSSRNLFQLCWFDEEHCRQGINALASYHSEYDESKRVVKLTPVHDWASHGADAFQTLALAHDFTLTSYEEFENYHGGRESHGRSWATGY